jgi:prepilin-type N-terminal cleavage/methylation domain-containing protein
MERSIMELIRRKKHCRAVGKQDGLTIIELMIAMVVLAVGILGSMSLVIMAINGNFRSKQQSNSVALAQMVTEKIMSIPAYTNPTLILTDCTVTNYNVSTAASAVGSATGLGAPLTSSGDVDYTQAKVANYNMPYTDCGTANRQLTYDVRWNIKGLSTYSKLLTVSARLSSVTTGATSGSVFGPVVTIKTVIGQGT